MAILSKIRERSLALVAVVGLALFAFVLDPSTLTDFFSSSKINEVGSVNGEAISRQEYAKEIDDYKTNVNNRATEMQVANAVWDRILRERIYTNQLEESGITVGESDIWQTVISNPSIAGNPQFANEVGLFDENKFKQFLKSAQESPDQRQWQAWKGYMDQLGSDLKRQTYINLIKAGLGASLKEGELQYKEENTLLSGDYVYIPFSSIPDSLVTVTKSEIESYVKDHAKEFDVEATRDISYVKFDILPSAKDREAIKNKVSSFLDDRKAYSKVTKSEVVVTGLKNTTDYETFFADNGSVEPFAESYFMDYQLPEEIKEEAFNKKVGETFGPYEQRSSFMISKITEIVKRPDSVKSSHIIIPYIGTLAANPNTTKTEEQAKKTADSIFKLVRNNKEKFGKIADEINTDGSKGKGGDIGWVTQSQAFSTTFDEDFAKFIYENKKGKVGVVKTKFGFHVIRVDDQTKPKKSIKLVTFGRKIEPSQETENAVFQEAEKFALEISAEGKDFAGVAKEKNYNVRPAIGLRVLGENIPGMPGSQRQIINWAYNKDTKMGDFKRFDIDRGYVVVTLTGKSEDGLMSATKAQGRVRPILMNEKKAKLIKEKMNGSTLNDISEANNTTIRKATDIALKSPLLTGVGNEPKVIGAMYYARENQLYTKVVGGKGVFAFVVTKKVAPTELPNYESNRTRIAESRRNGEFFMYQALKKASNVKDNRAVYYGVQQ